MQPTNSFTNPYFDTCQWNNILPISKDEAEKNKRLQAIDTIVQSLQENKMHPAQIDTFTHFEKALIDMPKEGSHVIIHAQPESEGGAPINPTAVPQEVLSYRCGFGDASKTEMQQNTEAFLALPDNGAHQGFIWVNTFSNVNTSIPNSNPEPFEIEDPLAPSTVKTFPSTEFYYQYCKLAYFVNKMPEEDKDKNGWREKLQTAITDPQYQPPIEAFRFGRQNVPGYDADQWKKDGKDLTAMKSCIYAKFTQNPLLMAELVLTGKDSRPLVQMKPDDYWGTGKNGDGKNLLGACLMEVREDIIAGRMTPAFTL